MRWTLIIIVMLLGLALGVSCAKRQLEEHSFELALAYAVSATPYHTMLLTDRES